MRWRALPTAGPRSLEGMHAEKARRTAWLSLFLKLS
jgi:hypothetical protein